MLTTILDFVLKDLKLVSYKQLKVGFYSCSHYRKMNIFAEIINSNES